MEKNGDVEPDNNIHKTKVIIVGAGMAGLSAAYHLTKNGFTDFKVLEARNRIGGRIIQIPIGEEKIELGANWIHGVLGNPVYELAMQHGLVDILAYPKPHKVIAATEQGKQVPFSILNEIYEAYFCFLRRCEEYFESQYSPPEGIESVGDHIKLEVSLYLDKIQEKSERHLRELLFDCLLKRETCISGCDNMNEIDLLEIGSYTELQGGNVILPNGYSSILGPLKTVIPEDSILIKHPVKSIRWKSGKRSKRSRLNRENSDSDDSQSTVIESPSCSNRASGEKPSERFNVEVICDNGKRFLGDHVICTLPLGVLKQTLETMFQPPLPEYKLEAIDRLLFGTVDKILLEYDRPFLHPNITEVLLLWEPAKEKNVDIAKNWYRKIYSFSKITETLILGWISGKEAEYMETLKNDVIIDVCTKILRKFLNDPFIPKPKTCVCTSWHSQPYTRGSYTAIAVGSSQLDIEYLAQPIYADEQESKNMEGMDHSQHNMPDHQEMDHSHHMDQSGHMGHTSSNSSGGHMMAMYFFFSKSSTVLFKEWTFSTVGGLVGSMIGIFIMAALYEGLKYFREYLFWKTYNSLQYRAVSIPEKGTTSEEPQVVQPTMMSKMHFLQTFLHMIQMVISYFLMLIFMTYNTWLCLAVVLGAGVGYFLFGWKKSVVVDVTEHCH